MAKGDVFQVVTNRQITPILIERETQEIEGACHQSLTKQVGKLCVNSIFVMKKFTYYLVTVLASFLFSSCLDSETTIHLEKDGSGTIVEKTAFGVRAVAMLKEISDAGKPGDKDPLVDMFSEEKAKARAALLGEGVTYEQTSTVAKSGVKIVEITYHFTDINKVRIVPGSSTGESSPDPKEESIVGKKAPAQPLTFSYADSTLELTMPKQEKPAKGSDDGETADLSGMGNKEKAMMKELYGDMKMSFKLVVNSGIVESDASYREGNMITLVSMDMAKVFNNPESFKKLQSTNEADPLATIESLKEFDGIKLESKSKVTVKLK